MAPGEPASNRQPDTDSVRRFLDGRVEGDLLSWPGQLAVMEHFGLTCAESEDAILSAGVLPVRYTRNRAMLSIDLQLRLFRSRVAVVGCGGLGGYVLEELARLGVGHLIAVDPDNFIDHNLNRQLLATLSNLGSNKADAASARIAAVNPAVTVHAITRAFGIDDTSALAGADAVADALDEVPARLTLADACGTLGIPLVHGAIAGWYGYVTTIFPGERTLSRLYSRHARDRGIEARFGNPSFTPAVVASLQVAEVCKVLIGQGTLLRNKVLTVNLLEMEIETIPLES